MKTMEIVHCVEASQSKHKAGVVQCTTELLKGKNKNTQKGRND